MEKEVNKILERLSMEVISLDEARAEMRILGLFNVVGQSEQLPLCSCVKASDPKDCDNYHRQEGICYYCTE